MCVALCVNPPALHRGISQVNPSHSVSDEKNTASHTHTETHVFLLSNMLFILFCINLDRACMNIILHLLSLNPLLLSLSLSLFVCLYALFLMMSTSLFQPSVLFGSLNALMSYLLLPSFNSTRLLCPTTTICVTPSSYLHHPRKCVSFQRQHHYWGEHRGVHWRAA